MSLTSKIDALATRIGQEIKALWAAIDASNSGVALIQGGTASITGTVLSGGTASSTGPRIDFGVAL